MATHRGKWRSCEWGRRPDGSMSSRKWRDLTKPNWQSINRAGWRSEKRPPGWRQDYWVCWRDNLGAWQSAKARMGWERPQLMAPCAPFIGTSAYKGSCSETWRWSEQKQKRLPPPCCGLRSAGFNGLFATTCSLNQCSRYYYWLRLVRTVAL